MRGRRGARNNPRDYGIAGNFGSGLRDSKTLLGTRDVDFAPRCVKEVPLLSKMVYKRVRGRTSGQSLPV